MQNFQSCNVRDIMFLFLAFDKFSFDANEGLDCIFDTDAILSASVEPNFIFPTLPIHKRVSNV
jgi:hypothetical protein